MAYSVPRRTRFVPHCLKSAETARAFTYFHVNRSGAEVPERVAYERTELAVRQAVPPLVFDLGDHEEGPYPIAADISYCRASGPACASARARRQGARPADAARSRRAHLRPREARPKILPVGLTSTAKVLPHRSRPTSKRILCPGTTDEITVRSLPVTWAAISDCDPSSLRMATPWSQSNDFRIAIAMKVALKATPHASTGLFRRHQPCACRTCADGRKESRRN